MLTVDDDGAGGAARADLEGDGSSLAIEYNPNAAKSDEPFADWAAPTPRSNSQEQRHKRSALERHTPRAHFADELDYRGAPVAAVHAGRRQEPLQKHAVLIALTQGVEHLSQPWVVFGSHH